MKTYKIYWCKMVKESIVKAGSTREAMEKASKPMYKGIEFHSITEVAKSDK